MYVHTCWYVCMYACTYMYAHTYMYLVDYRVELHCPGILSEVILNKWTVAQADSWISGQSNTEVQHVPNICKVIHTLGLQRRIYELPSLAQTVIFLGLCSDGSTSTCKHTTFTHYISLSARVILYIPCLQTCQFQAEIQGKHCDLKCYQSQLARWQWGKIVGVPWYGWSR